jgi:hypothetical protein
MPPFGGAFLRGVGTVLVSILFLSLVLAGISMIIVLATRLIGNGRIIEGFALDAFAFWLCFELVVLVEDWWKS